VGREISVLVVALEERVAADLQAPQPGMPPELLLARLTKRLVDNHFRLFCLISTPLTVWD
jgi:hypothetical protein